VCSPRSRLACSRPVLFTPGHSSWIASTTCSPPRPAPLRPTTAACAEAYGWAGADTITLPAGTYLLAPEPPPGAPDKEWGDLDIDDPQDLTIQGAGASTTFINANGSLTGTSAFSSSVGAGTLALLDLTITGGALGGIRSNRALSLTRVAISGNSSIITGGGVAHFGGTLTLDHVTLSSNQATGGAGLRLQSGTLIIGDSSVNDNQATGGGAGGGISIGPSATSFSINSTTISGNTAASGGGLSIEGGNGSLSYVTIQGNTASDGGGMSRSGGGTTDIINSTIASNSAASEGGGLYAHSAGVVNLTGTTLTGNTAASLDDHSGGGGIFSYATQVVMTNCTLSGNSARSDGAAVLIYEAPASATIASSTIARNTPDSDATGGGDASVYTLGPISLVSTIVAESTGVQCAARGAGTLTSSGHNLASDASCNLTQPSDLASGVANLGPLADNGGPTRTHALMPGSQAIDASSMAVCPSLDQRGVLRPIHAECDIGAYEAGWWVLLPVVLRQFP
jgi:hypothetical protein